MAQPENNAEQEINIVTLHLPPFWTKMPAQWFVGVEAQFSTRKIRKEKSKYGYLLAALPQDIVATVYDVIMTLSETIDDDDATPYSTLKQSLIERHTLSESAKLEALFSNQEMGDNKPSEFFRSLKTLAGPTIATDDLLIKLWLRRLPTMIQATLRAVPKAEVPDLLKMADNMYEVYQQQGPSVQAISNIPIKQNNSEIQELRKEIRDLKKIVSSYVSSSSSPRARSQSRSRFRSRKNSQSQDDKNQGSMCWYHKKFGSKANKCNQPCSFIKSNNPN